MITAAAWRPFPCRAGRWGLSAASTHIRWQLHCSCRMTKVDRRYNVQMLALFKCRSAKREDKMRHASVRSARKAEINSAKGAGIAGICARACREIKGLPPQRHRRCREISDGGSRVWYHSDGVGDAKCAALVVQLRIPRFVLRRALEDGFWRDDRQAAVRVVLRDSADGSPLWLRALGHVSIQSSSPLRSPSWAFVSDPERIVLDGSCSLAAFLMGLVSVPSAGACKNVERVQRNSLIAGGLYAAKSLTPVTVTKQEECNGGASS
jgi:hypothetical protein